MYKDNQDRVDSYLRGEMTTEERNQFESDIIIDSILRETYIETKAISDAISDRKKKLLAMVQWDAEEKVRLEIEHRKKVRRWTIGVSAAACVAFALLLRPLYYTTSSNDICMMPDFSHEASYRGGDSSLEILDSLIKDKEYDRALTFADSLIDKSRLDLAQYELMDSISEKDYYYKSISEDCLYDIEWRKANLLLVLGKESEASCLLKRLASKENVYSVRADSLLKTINQKKNIFFNN